MTQKTTVETRDRRVGELIPQPHGGALRNGGPNRGGPGRPRNEFKERMREIASSDAALEYLRECVDGKYGPMVAIAAHRHVTNRGYGRARMEAEPDQEHAVLIMRDVRELPGNPEG